MSVSKEASGRRSVQVEVEVPGTLEQVWQAIATGPGISSWFVPASVEQKDGQPVAVTLTFAPGMESSSKVTLWDPPHRFFRESDGWVPGSPALATEFTIEAKSGDSCVVRVVQSLFASTDDWDGQLTGAEEGWPGIFRILRMYLAHFRGQPCAIMQVMQPVAGSAADAWASLTAALSLDHAAEGHAWTARTGAPALGGIVDHLSMQPFGALVRLDSPGPGAAAFGTIEFGDTVMATLTCYMYGETASDLVARETPVWQAWFQQQFPMPQPAAQ